MQKNPQTHLMSQCCLHVYAGKKNKLDKNGKIHEFDHLYMLLVIHFHIA